MIQHERRLHLATSSNPETSAYRKHTTALLRRYFRVSMSAGRLSSPLAAPEPRARVSSYRVTTFEDAMIFVHDVERCLQKLEAWALESIAAFALLELPREQAAAALNVSVAQADRRYAIALDRLSSVLLESGLMTRNFDDPDSEECGYATRRNCRTAEQKDSAQSVPRKPSTSAHGVSNKVLRIIR